MLLKEQVPAADFIINTPGAALFSEQGTGKTIITLAAIEKLNPQLILIVTPLTSVDLTWGDRLKTFHHRICRTIEEVRQGLGPRVLLIHYQYAARVITRLLRLEFDMIIFDESQHLKARSSTWSRVARRLRKFPRKLILSGTPIDKSPIDVWAQMRFIAPQALGDRWSDFDEEFLRPCGFMGYKREFIQSRMPVFLKKIEPYAFRLNSEFLNLKPLRIHPIPVSLLGSQLKAYDQMASTMILRGDGFKVKAPLAITQKVKLEQITGGFIIDDNYDVHLLGRSKERKLRWLAPRLTKPIVVFCKFLHEMDVVESVLKEHCRVVRRLSGEIKDIKRVKHRTQLIRDFQAGLVDGLVCQYRTGGVSIELTRARNMVFYSMNHSFIDFDQIVKRFHRKGQEEQVDVYLLFAENTVDEEIIDVIDSKRSTAYEVVSHIEQRSSEMAKKSKKKVVAKTAGDNAKIEKAKFGIGDFAKALKLEPASARAGIRSRGLKIKKVGRGYGWNSREALMKDVEAYNVAGG